MPRLRVDPTGGNLDDVLQRLLAAVAVRNPEPFHQIDHIGVLIRHQGSGLHVPQVEQ
jgi:hypothetical protein